MDFAFSPAQEEWYEAAVRFARDELVDADGLAREERERDPQGHRAQLVPMGQQDPEIDVRNDDDGGRNGDPGPGERNQERTRGDHEGHDDRMLLALRRTHVQAD